MHYRLSLYRVEAKLLLVSKGKMMIFSFIWPYCGRVSM